MHAPLPPNCKDDGHPDAIEAQLGPLEFDRRNCSYLDGTWDERDLQIINYQGDNNVTFYVQRSSQPGPRIPEYDCDFGDEKPAPLRVTGIEYGTASAQCVEGEDDPAPGLTTGEKAGIGLGAVFTAGVLVIAGKKGYDKCQDQAAGAGPAALAGLVAVPLNPAEGS